MLAILLLCAAAGTAASSADNGANSGAESARLEPSRTPRSLEAQSVEDGSAPRASSVRFETAPQFSPSSGESFGTASVEVTITWCASEPLFSNSRVIQVNGETVTGSFTYQALGGSFPCFDIDGTQRAQSVGTITLHEGINRVVATICSEIVCGTDSATYTLLSPPAPAPIQWVRVSPDSTLSSAAAFATDTQRFWVRRVSGTESTFLLDATCDRVAVLSCTPSASSVTLGAGDSTPVDLAFVAGPVGATGTLRLRAYRGADPHNQDDGSARLTIGSGAPSTTRVRVRDASHPTAVSRDLCFTAAVIKDVSVVCGDLQVVHPLPAIAVRNRTLEPTLLYNSRLASGIALLAAGITMPSGATPTRVTATLSTRSSGGTWSTATTGDWAGTPFTPGRTVQVALAWEMAGTGTRLVPYRLDVTAWDGGTPRATVRDSGSMAFVDRSGSSFGAGWSLVGLDQLVAASGAAPSPSDSSLLLVGGDGSTRRFRRTATHLWRGDTVDVRDSLRYDSANLRYERRLPGGTVVQFDAAGRHVATVDRLGIATLFEYDGLSRLVRIKPSGLTATTHTVTYGSNTVTICAQADCSDTTTARAARLSIASGVVTSISGVGGRVSFQSDAARRVTRRVNRRSDTTHFAYVGRAGVVDTTTIEWADTTWRRLVFKHGQVAGLGSPSAQASATPLLDVATLIKGPRHLDGVGDSTRVWLDQFGAPRAIRDPARRTTTLGRGDRRFPAPVTEQRAPNGFRTWAMFDTLGNLSITGAENPYADGRNAWTTYQWDGKWAMPTRVTNPTRDWSGTAYDPSTGNRVKVFGMRADTTRFTYVAGTGMDRKLLAQVQQPFDIVESYGYDTMGNLNRIVSPTGDTTRIHRDSLGRDTLRTSPIASGIVETTRTTYDGRDRVQVQRRNGPARNYTLRSFPSLTTTVAAESITVTYAYDGENNVTGVTSDGHGEAHTSQSESHSYNPANEVTQRINAAGTHVLQRDRAGNVIRERVPGEAVDIVSSVDAAGRLVQRLTPAKYLAASGCAGFPDGPLTQSFCQLSFPLFPNDTGPGYLVPADTAVFAYDTTGGVSSATNRNASVRRRYFPGGQLKSDSSGALGFVVGYDVGGRRVWLRTAGDTLRFEYHPFGALRRLTLPAGAWYRFTYDSLMRVDSLVVRPNAPLVPGVREKRRYDARSRLWVRTRVSAMLGQLTKDSLTYDARDRVLRADVQSLALGGETTTLSYSGLGSLAASERTRAVGGYFIEQFTTDAVGTVLSSRQRSSSNIDTLIYENAYAAYGSLSERSYGPLPQNEFSDGRLYDVARAQFSDAGTRTVRAGESQRRIVYSGNPPTPGPDYSRQTASRSFYGADGRLAVVQRYGWLPSARDGSWEEYRYDAFGRRVQTVVRRDSQALCSGSAWCESHTATTLWDGDAVLLESRVPTQGETTDPKVHGTRIYVPGLQLDQPLGTWNGRVFNPSWRGVFESSVWMDGSAGDQSVGTNTGTLVDWPAAKGVYWTPGPGSTDAMPPRYAWLGDLAINGQQSTGQLYRRNRFYDPESGQFAQPDPIGLAGGLNLFGFAGGDPVNFADPFGLNPLLRLSLWWLNRGHRLVASVGAALTGLRGAEAPGGGLLAHEARGGHTISRHVARGLVDLSARLTSEPRLSVASSFASRAAAERGVARAIAQNSSQLMEWLRGDRPRLVLDGDLAAGLGYVLRRGAETTEAATRVRVVLDRAAESSLGYVIRTAYPTP